MRKENEKKSLYRFSARISGVLSCIPETKIILTELATGSTYEDIEKKVLLDNILDKRTLRSRKKVLSAIKLRFLSNPHIKLKPLIKFINSGISENSKNLIIYYHLCKSEKIVYDLTSKFLYEKFLDGRLGVSKNEALDFLNNQIGAHPELKKWTSITKERVIEHYLAIMKDFGFLKGSKKKEFNIDYVPLEVIMYVVFILLDEGKNVKQVLNSEDFKLFFINRDEIIRYLMDATRKGIVDFKYREGIYELNPRGKGLNEYVDEITRKI
jgi:hypothetical protein